MANTKSAQKRIRANQKRADRNKMYRSRVKTLIRKSEIGIAGGKPNEAELREALSTLDKAAGKGIIHKNNAARRKSRLVAKYKAATAAK